MPGFKIIKFKGIQWNKTKIYSRTLPEQFINKFLINPPCWVTEYK